MLGYDTQFAAITTREHVAGLRKSYAAGRVPYRSDDADRDARHGRAAPTRSGFRHGSPPMRRGRFAAGGLVPSSPAESSPVRGSTPTEWSSSGRRAKRASSGCASSSAWKTTTPSSSSASPTIRSSAARRASSRVSARCGWPTVAHALLRALAGQLVTWQHAKEIERDVIRRTSPRHACGLYEPPTGESLGRVGTAELRKLGLHARRAAALVRLCRSVDLERLHDLPTYSVVKRLAREPGLGPWSAGVVCLQGLGRLRARARRRPRT